MNTVNKLFIVLLILTTSNIYSSCSDSFSAIEFPAELPSFNVVDDKGLSVDSTLFDSGNSVIYFPNDKYIDNVYEKSVSLFKELHQDVNFKAFIIV